jgi:hypothetical protein
MTTLTQVTSAVETEIPVIKKEIIKDTNLFVLWVKTNPLKALFLLGFLVGFILGTLF